MVDLNADDAIRGAWPGLGWLGLLLDFGFGAEESKLGGKRPCEGGMAENAEVFASWGVRGERV